MRTELLKIQVQLNWQNYARTGNFKYWQKGYDAFNELALLKTELMAQYHQ